MYSSSEAQEAVVIRNEHVEAGLLADGGEEVLEIVNGGHVSCFLYIYFMVMIKSFRIIE